MPKIYLDNVSLTVPVFNLRKPSIFNKSHVKKETLLHDISFSLNAGDRLGIVGCNGSGKSTLLRVLSRIYHPTSGSINIDGFVVPMLDLSMGMNNYLTGMQNILLKGLLLGKDKKWFKEKKDEIIHFSGIEDFIYKPIINYSSGMRMRLGFSISVFCSAEILLLDEVIAVGDAEFQNKAKKKIKEITNEARIFVLALHSSMTIMELCNKAIWIDKGSVKMLGDSHSVIRAYDDFVHGRNNE